MSGPTMAHKMHGEHPTGSYRAITTLNTLRIKPFDCSRRHLSHRSTFQASTFPPLTVPPKQRRPQPSPSLMPIAALPSNSAEYTPASDQTWNILDAPGLTPPRSQLPRNDPLSRLAYALHAVLAWLFPPFASAELLRRLFVTLSMLALVRIGHYIPTPGLNLNAILNPNGVPGAAGTSLSLTSLLTGSMELPGNMFILSITPYMTAYFALAIFQIIPEVRRQMNQLRDQGRQGREVINAYVNILFIVCAVTQALVESGKLVPLAAVGTLGGWFRSQATVTLLAGAVICKYAVQTVEQWGLGDGAGIVIGAGIALGKRRAVSP